MMGDLRREYVPWLKVLNHFCDQSVIEEYNSLANIESKLKYLDCLKGITMNAVRNIFPSSTRGKLKLVSSST